jgi:hypothetical protein
VLCCWEASPDRCHRGLFSAWWLIATVTLAEDTKPAVLGVGGGFGWEGTDNGVRERLSRPVALEGLHDALVWLIREGER